MLKPWPEENAANSKYSGITPQNLPEIGWEVLALSRWSDASPSQQQTLYIHRKLTLIDPVERVCGQKGKTTAICKFMNRFAVKFEWEYNTYDIPLRGITVVSGPVYSPWRNPCFNFSPGCWLLRLTKRTIETMMDLQCHTDWYVALKFDLTIQKWIYNLGDLRLLRTRRSEAAGNGVAGDLILSMAEGGVLHPL